MSFVYPFIIYCLLFYIITILTPFFFIFLAYLTPGGMSSVIIGHRYSSLNRTSNQINGGVKGC